MSNDVAEIVATLDALPEGERRLLCDYLAGHLPDVLDEARWQQSFDASEPMLLQMSREVDDAIARGDVAALDPDEL